jgi:secondary thiamine-phosphate synthase enzyme
MEWYKATLTVATKKKGMVDFTSLIEQHLRSSGIQEGMCFLYIQHTSASLVISESYDRSAQQDMETYMEHAVPEGESWYRHTLEGLDDSPSHIRAMLTSTSLAIPIENGRLALGTWQGVYLFEHRQRGNTRHVLIRCMGVPE